MLSTVAFVVGAAALAAAVSFTVTFTITTIIEQVYHARTEH